MKQTDTPSEAGGGLYEIRLTGHLDGRWATTFDGLGFTHEPDGTTVIHGRVLDQSALHGLLRKVRDIGLPLVSVIRTDAGRPEPPSTERR